MLLVYMYDYNSNMSILFLKKNQNYTKFYKVIQLQAEVSTESPVIILP